MTDNERRAEIEAVARALMNWRERTADPHGDYWTSLADAAIAALDRARDARGDDTAQFWLRKAQEAEAELARASTALDEVVAYFDDGHRLPPAGFPLASVVRPAAESLSRVRDV